MAGGLLFNLLRPPDRWRILMLVMRARLAGVGVLVLLYLAQPVIGIAALAAVFGYVVAQRLPRISRR